MMHFADKKTLFTDRYQALIMPVPVSGIFRHRLLLRTQMLYPEQYTLYKQACEKAELALGQNLLYQSQRDLAGMAVGGALSKPKFIVSMAVTEFAENPPHLEHLVACFQQLEPILLDWGRYGGIRRVALIAVDELIVPKDLSFEETVLPLIERYFQPLSQLNVVIYR